TASILQIGSALPQLTGNITVSSAITQAGSNYSTLLLNTTGSVTSTATGSIATTNLAIFAGAGIGTAGTPLATQVTNLDFNNAHPGGVTVLTTRGLTLPNVAGAGPALNNAPGQPIPLATTGGPITFAVDTTSLGTITATATETGSNGDDVTVNAGVTVQGD